jgi:hypothetical protein
MADAKQSWTLIQLAETAHRYNEKADRLISSKGADEKCVLSAETLINFVDAAHDWQTINGQKRLTSLYTSIVKGDFSNAEFKSLASEVKDKAEVKLSRLEP